MSVLYHEFQDKSGRRNFLYRAPGLPLLITVGEREAMNASMVHEKELTLAVEYGAGTSYLFTFYPHQRHVRDDLVLWLIDGSQE